VPQEHFTSTELSDSIDTEDKPVSRRIFPSVVAAVAALGALEIWGKPKQSVFPVPKVSAQVDGTSNIYFVGGYQGVVNDRHKGLEKLFTLMGSNGLHVLRSQDTGQINGPDGLIAKDEIVLIKINCQWDEARAADSNTGVGFVDLSEISPTPVASG